VNDPARISLIEDGLAGLAALRERWPSDSWQPMVRDYLLYLLAVERGEEADRSRIEWSGFGVLAVREIEALDMDLAETFYAISAMARDMVARP
jgi:hypothetical protein